MIGYFHICYPLSQISQLLLPSNYLSFSPTDIIIMATITASFTGTMARTDVYSRKPPPPSLLPCNVTAAPPKHTSEP
ncbi:hypothetical protein L2E82_03691 [Cichorium intybus]|uniref:Uncharacterized protein n=1 Tax=Cichorium intybus TaxID=13427 RepID=A0ACB9H5X0_CICIN|nr:hypothetical protein L2E82_03691 [Cichorium intybus]